MTSFANNLVIALIASGRNFPKRTGYLLIIEAKFDSEVLSSDPVDHVENPMFLQELAWEVNNKDLHQHKLHRSCVKLQFFALHKKSKVKELIGYNILDVRTASNKPKQKWFPLLHSKYIKNKPEVQMAIFIDEIPNSLNSSKKKSSVNDDSFLRVKDSTASQNFLKPVLNEKGGFLQIGPASVATDMFIFSVTISFAANLPKLISKEQLDSLNGDYFFFYNIFGNDITTEPFFDIVSSSFQAERASICLKSSIETLQKFFNSQPSIEIHLCTGEKSLGSCLVPLNNLISDTSDNTSPFTLEGSYQIYSPITKTLNLSEEDSPFIGLSVVLKRDDPQSVPLDQDKDNKNAKIVEDAPKVSGVTSESKPMQQSTQTSTKSKKKDEDTLKISDKKLSKLSKKHSKKHTEVIAHKNVSQTKKKKKTQEESPNEKTSRSPIKSSPEVKIADTVGSQSKNSLYVPPSAEDLSTDEILHHFTVTINIRHIRNELSLNLKQQYSLETSLNIYIRYVYSFFGSPMPILTSPPVQMSIDASQNDNISLPNAYTVFEFASTFDHMHEQFTKVPLTLELWNRRGNSGQDYLFAVGRLEMQSLLDVPRYRITMLSGKQVFRRSLIQTLPLYSFDVRASTTSKQHQRCASVDVQLILEDHGELDSDIKLVKSHIIDTQRKAERDTPPIRPESASKSLKKFNTGPSLLPSTSTSNYASTDKNTSAVLRVDSRQNTPIVENHVAASQQNNPNMITSVESLRSRPEYRSALELELWKESQQQLFELKLKEKESAHLKTLSADFEKREKERENVLSRRLQDCKLLEDRLKNALHELEAKEKTLNEREFSLERTRNAIEHEQRLKMETIEEARRRFEGETQARSRMEKERQDTAAQMLESTKEQLRESERRCNMLEERLTSFKLEANSKPEVKLQAEINLLTLEKVELDRKLDQMTKSKNHYKESWGRALKEVARLKERQQIDAKTQLSRQQAELDHMRLRYLATEEKSLLNREVSNIKDLRSQIHELTSSMAEGMETNQSVKDVVSSFSSLPATSTATTMKNFPSRHQLPPQEKEVVSTSSSPQFSGKKEKMVASSSSSFNVYNPLFPSSTSDSVGKSPPSISRRRQISPSCWNGDANDEGTSSLPTQATSSLSSPNRVRLDPMPLADTSILEDHISRMIEERETLLRTGIYSLQDRIITELDAQIKEAMEHRSSLKKR